MMPPTSPYGQDEGWYTTQPSRNVVHVLPVDDLIEHVMDQGCVCGPSTETVVSDNGEIGWVIAHPALDARP